MNSQKDYYVLQGGVKIPCIGFGTWQTPDGETAIAAVKEALDCGYRHIDTAEMYGNQTGIGTAIKDSGVKREEIFVTSKLANTEHGYEATKAAFAKTLQELQLDYLDLYLIHWPNSIKFREHWKETNAQTWKAMEELYQEGKIRAIGISNFMPHHIDALLETATVVPMVNQIRLCPGETQPEVVAYCREKNILLEAYSPLGTGRIFEVQEMKELEQKYHKSIAQICIRYSLQMGYLPLPKSVHADRIRENIEVFDFELSEDDVKMISGLRDCCGPTKDPDTTGF